MIRRFARSNRTSSSETVVSFILDHHLAEINVARLRRPLDAAETAEFVAALEPINLIAERSPGFVWRLTDNSGQASTFVRLPEIEDPLMIVNYSIWSDLESFKHYVYKSGHASYLRRKNDWFEPIEQPAVACWWAPADSEPDAQDAFRRLEHLRNHGPTELGWPPNKPIPAPDAK